jgi:seryl-tRNA synthetase
LRRLADGASENKEDNEMLDVKRLRSDFDGVKAALAKRHKDYHLEKFTELDEKRRTLIQQIEALKAEQNADTKKIPQMKKNGEDTTELMAQMKALSDKIKALDPEVKAVDDEIRQFLLSVPNTPNPQVADGVDDSENVEMRKFGEPRKFDFDFKTHWDLGEALDIFDFERATKIAGSRFTVYKGLGARLERAVANFMLDTHVEKHGYKEVFPPFMVNRASMTGTGQLPKFEEDAYNVKNNDFFLVPTAEVPVTNLHRDEILDGKDLTIKYCAYTACFRAEAGSAGRDVKGVIRQHQFNKVELVKFARPDNSYEELEKLTDDAEDILRLLGLPYRVVRLCSGDLGFSSAMTYDIEVWMPSYNRYVEISSCSDFEDYQARRANIRFKDNVKDKAQFVHTLNGSGLAVGRTTAAILENYQNEDGSITIPEVLVPYMGGKTVIK